MTDAEMMFVMIVSGTGLVIAVMMTIWVILHEDDLKGR